jgi:hypothetical protein
MALEVPVQDQVGPLLWASGKGVRGQWCVCREVTEKTAHINSQLAE